MMLLQGDVLAHVTTIINTDAYKLYSIYYILYVLCLYIIDLTVQFHCYTVIEMLLQFTVIIAKVAPSIATKTGLRESLLTYGFLDYVHGYMFFLTMGLIKHFFFFFFLLRDLLAATNRSTQHCRKFAFIGSICAHDVSIGCYETWHAFKNDINTIIINT